MVRERTVETPGGTEAADRVADVLLLFARSDSPLGVSQIARDLSLSKAVVHRILQSLVSRSLAKVVPGGSSYVLGPAALGLSARAWSQIDVRSIASPILRRLRDTTRETTTLSVLVGNERIYLDQFESPEEVKMVIEIGPRYPLHSGASSRAILAFLSLSLIDEAVRQLRARRAGLDEDGYRDGLDRVREQGYATSINERNTGAASIAAPFFDSAGNVMGSISSSGPAFRYAIEDHEEHAALVVEASHAITQRLRG
ncbi:IclR family transcriptional regulator [Amycolatopsis rhabdoformis]|uniref:IclR family transcriptional regulator n=1 Tax=Amycolatopsis rhabdoformis TaxID=1448059 RepID=A0ABZ1IHC0_9PSEU|nr:IclR family transcriptional regulator [Amycolatopsis rhabdoformis]WSE33870.1 IclR family transcriptional regulator [Amycolatopsis rhabdoformis]